MKMTTRERVEKVTPLEKFCVIAEDVDRLREHLKMVDGSQSLDELVEVVNVAELADRYEIKPQMMRAKLKNAGGKVFKIGKKWVIRKVQLLTVLELMEDAA